MNNLNEKCHLTPRTNDMIWVLFINRWLNFFSILERFPRIKIKNQDVRCHMFRFIYDVCFMMYGDNGVQRREESQDDAGARRGCHREVEADASQYCIKVGQ